MRINLLSNPLFVAVITAMTLSACGKNMSVAMKDAKEAEKTVVVNANKPATLANVSVPRADAKKKEKAAPAKEVAEAVPAKVEEVKSAPASDVKPATPNAPAAVPVNDILNTAAVESAVEAKDGELHPYSVFDLQDASAKRIFKNEGKDDATQVISSPSYMDRETGIGFVKNSNVVFRSILQIAAKDSIKSVSKFELVLAGLRLYDAKGTGLEKRALSNQVICIAETGECSGELPADADKGNLADASKLNLKSDLFAKVELNKLIDYKEQGALFENGHEIRLDMIELFGLQKLSAAELADWIYANSTEFGSPNFRKFRFVMGNQVFVETGVLNLVYKTTQPPVASENTDTILNGETDAQTPVDRAAIAMPELASTTNTTQTAALGASNNEARPALQPEQVPAGTVTQDAVTGTASVTPPVDTSPASPAPAAAPAPEAAPVVAAAPAPAAAPVVASAQASSELDAIIAANDNSTEFEGDVQKSATAEVKKERPILEAAKNKAGNNALRIHLDEYHLEFNTNQADLKTAEDIMKLVHTADLIKANDKIVSNVIVYGRTDKEGSRKSNGKLAQARADRVKELLLPRSQAKITPIGLNEPKVSKCKTERCQADRKVDIQINFEKNAKTSAIKAMRLKLAKIWKLSNKQN